ncbi:hypothetical protein BX666DRAFT_1979849 [Dichotomocladium elegans]|nr:hypothetical protein BX666DRAFT_1979849 [Dichotomocladium elegans]
MEGSAVGSIPRSLLARILLQLHVIPQHYVFNLGDDLYRILVAGLQKYGETSDLSGLLKFCLNEAEEVNRAVGGKQTQWWWKDFSVSRESDWDRLDTAYPLNTSEPVNLHVEILNEEARKGAVDIKYAKEVTALEEKRLFYSYEDTPIPIDSILCGTLSYLEKTQQQSVEEISATATLTQLIENRLEKFARERYEHRISSGNNLCADSNYTLMGALMRRRRINDDNDSKAKPGWCLYLRDYISSDSGTLWRVVSEYSTQTPEINVSATQALADIRGIPTSANDHGNSVLEPSEWSRSYQPVYLFYTNSGLVERTLNMSYAAPDDIKPSAQNEDSEHTNDASGIITYDDYLLDEDMPDYAPQDEQDDDVCKVCGIPDIIKDYNNINREF